MLALTGIPVAAAAAFFPFAVAIPVVILLFGSWSALRAGGARATGRWSLAASWFVAAPVVAFRALSHCGLTLF